MAALDNIDRANACGVRDGGKRGSVLRGAVRGNVCVMHSGSGVGANVAYRLTVSVWEGVGERLSVRSERAKTGGGGHCGTLRIGKERHKAGLMAKRAELTKSVRGGRPKLATEIAVLDAVNRAMPPEKVERILNDAFDWCEEHKSVNGVHKLLTLVLAYQLGQPVKRVVSTKMKISDLINQVTDIDDDAFDDAIEAIYENSDK